MALFHLWRKGTTVFRTGKVDIWRTVPLLILISLVFLSSGCGGDVLRSRVLVLGMDGLEWDVINELMAEGKLPNFQHLIEQGTSGKFKSIRPILSPVIWTSIATGKSPSKHEITFFTVENPKTGEQHPITSDFRKTKALWNILSDNDRSVGVIGWWATWPSERVNGFMISDHVNYHFLHAKDSTQAVTTGSTYPPELRDQIQQYLAKPLEVQPKDVRDFIHLEDFPSDGVFRFSDPVDHFRWAYSTSESHRILGLNALKDYKLDTLMVFFEGPDSVSHLFGQYYRPDPERAKTLDPIKLEQFGRIVESFYIYMDSIIAQFIEAMPRDMNLILSSDHGFEMKEGTGVASAGVMELKEISERAHKEYGVLFLYGPDFKKGSRIMGAHVYDIAPTVLYLLGLPIADDMDGRLLAEAFHEQPRAVMKLETYETPGTHAERLADADSSFDPEIIQRLESLGYIGGESPKRLSNLGTITLEEGDLDKALQSYLEALPQSPDDPALLCNIGTAYGKKGDYAEAERYYHLALEKMPDFAQAYANLGLVCERTNRIQEAIEYYLRAVVLDEGLKEARTGLTRSLPRAPQSSFAQDLITEAEQFGKSGLYEQALEKLDSAAREAPGMASVYHYRSNIYYLMGKHQEACDALRLALALEPDNPLFRRNLEALSK